MNVVWIGEKLSTEIRRFVQEELSLSGNKVETETARKGILFAMRVKPDEFRDAWKNGLLNL